MSVAPTGPQGEHILVGACACIYVALYPSPSLFDSAETMHTLPHLTYFIGMSCSAARKSSLVETCLRIFFGLPGFHTGF